MVVVSGGDRVGHVSRSEGGMRDQVTVAVSWAVQAHPRRALMAKHLAGRIGGPVDVVFDPEPDAKLRSPWRTFRLLMESTPAWATHRAQIQDDATPCEGLRAAVELAVAARPDRLLVLYVGGNPRLHSDAVRAACGRGECWARLDPEQWVPVVATVWPSALAGALLSYVDAQRFPEGWTGDDEIVGRFVREHGVSALAVVPSLVQHANAVDSIVRKKIDPSPGGRVIRGDEDPGRVAALWIGDCTECDPLAFDWETGVHDFPENT